MLEPRIVAVRTIRCVRYVNVWFSGMTLQFSLFAVLDTALLAFDAALRGRDTLLDSERGEVWFNNGWQNMHPY